MKRGLLGIPVVLVLVLLTFTVTPFISTCGGHDDAMSELLGTCPRAVELLGADPHPARLGFACGTTKTSGDIGGAHWRQPFVGDKARGELTYAATKSHDEWRVTSAELEVDGERIDVMACAPVKPRPTPEPPRDRSSVLAQTNADAAQATFTGKVTRSSNTSIAVGYECTGKVARERASAFAELQVTCRADASEGEGTPLYTGRGKFTLEVNNPAQRDDDRMEFADERSATGCRLSAAAGTGTLTVFSVSEAWEVVVEL